LTLRFIEEERNIIINNKETETETKNGVELILEKIKEINLVKTNYYNNMINLLIK